MCIKNNQSLTNYFNKVPPPDLVTPNGVALKGVVVTKLTGLLAPAQYAKASLNAKAALLVRLKQLEGKPKLTTLTAQKAIFL